MSSSSTTIAGENWWRDPKLTRALDQFFSHVYQGRVPYAEIVLFLDRVFSSRHDERVRLEYLLDLGREIRQTGATRAREELVEEVKRMREGSSHARS